MKETSNDSAAGSTRLLGADDPPPVSVMNPGARSPFLLVGDHAGRAIPRGLAELGLGQVDRSRHIAWDIGIADLGRRLAVKLGAAFIAQAYSRLVIDCNRDPGRPDSICAMSDGSLIPGNVDLTDDERLRRRLEIFDPYHGRIAAELAERASHGLSTVLVALHSFTPSLGGKNRPWRYGVLHAGDSPFSRSLLAVLQARMRSVGDNQPYRMDETDYTIMRHASPARDYAELEVRQDLMASPGGRREVAELLGALLPEADRRRSGLGERHDG